MGKKRNYFIEGQLSLFDIQALPIERQTPEEFIESLRHGDVYRYRTKTIRAGNMLECEIYPIYKRAEKKRAKKAQPSKTAQENLNHKNTKKKIMRLTNTNFKSGDLWLTVGYDDEHLPQTPEQARKDIVNYLRRIKNKRKRLNLPPLKYIYVTEWSQNGERVRCHHHLILSGDIERDDIEALWRGGSYPHTRRLRVKEDCGLNGLAAYLSKGQKYEKRWGHSINLKPYDKATVADRKITPRQAAKIALDRSAAPELFEKVCAGYTFRDIEIKRSDFVAGVYIYTQMYRRL